MPPLSWKIKPSSSSPIEAVHDPVVLFDQGRINALLFRHNPDQIRKLRVIVEEVTRHAIRLFAARSKNFLARSLPYARTARLSASDQSRRRARPRAWEPRSFLGKLIDVVDEIDQQEFLRQRLGDARAHRQTGGRLPNPSTEAVQLDAARPLPPCAAVDQPASDTVILASRLARPRHWVIAGDRGPKKADEEVQGRSAFSISASPSFRPPKARPPPIRGRSHR